MNNYYVDIHALQILPPSCVNRDDTGAPKTAIYGGANRSRISSQAWKHAIREEFKNIFDSKDLGIRTKYIVSLVGADIQNLDSSISDEKAEKMAVEALKKAGLNVKDPKKGTDALLLMSPAQSKALAELIAAGESDTKKYKKALADSPSIDMALFGRMVAADPSLNYDAACQVAHAISTHPVETEFDYFTAVDDLKDDDQNGAGHIGSAEFNSSTIYRYATINVKELKKSLGLETPDAVEGFIKAFVTSMPTGKQNSFANNTLPSELYVAIRTDQPISLVGAFEKPVNGNDGLEEKSARQLVEYTQKLYNEFAEEPARSFTTGSGVKDLGENLKFKDLLVKVKQAVTEAIQDGEE